MSGKWKPKGVPTERHACNPPKYETRGERIEHGDRWECDDCKAQWIVQRVWRGDQREPLIYPDLPKIVWTDESPVRDPEEDS